MGIRNGFFQLALKQDGTYLRLFPAVDGGQQITYDEVNNYLSDKKIYDYDIKALGNALTVSKSEMNEVKLFASTVLPETECVKVIISSDRMSAIGRFYPASSNGQLMTSKEVINSLVHAGIKYGVIDESINSFFQRRKYCKDIILAQGIKPVEGRDAFINYHFNTDNTLKPKQNEDGSVDFHQLDRISSTNAGDILATLIPSIQGKAGIDICGNPIQARKVINKILKYSKGIHLSDDGLTMYSDVSGHVILADDKVIVSNTYDILADVDASTGDIVYEGDVTVKGNVITGFSIQAKGNIIVYGVVEGALLIAGGQIILKRGMQGMNKGRMEAGGNIITKFIENAQVTAGGSITTEAILHSKVSAQDDITVGGRKGYINGGEIRSTTAINVKTAGSTMGTNTLLEVGINPGVIEEYHNVEKNINNIKSELEKLLPVLTLYKKKISSGEKLSSDKIDYVRTSTQDCIALSTELRECTNRYEQLKIEMNNNSGGSIRVENIAYPGVKIVISNVICFVRNEVHYSKFIRDRADIKIIGL